MSIASASTLDDLARQFAQPLKEYSPVPIWWWSGEPLERSRLRWQMEQLISGGVYNVVILNLAPTSPLYGADQDDPAFLSEAWWDIFLGMCEDARELGMRVWFYDQIGFSGANLQGEIIRANPAFAGQSLASIVVEGSGALELTCPSEGTPLSAAWVRLDSSGQPVGDYTTVPLDGLATRADVPQHARLRLMYAIKRGFDYCSVEACDRLLDTVHREFERRAGHYFGSVIVGSFQDELPSMPMWSEDFFEQFSRIKGYNLRDHLTALWEGDSPHAESVRLDYQQVRAALAETAFFRPFMDWHRQHGLICGFDQQGPSRAGDPIGSVQQYADYLQTHRWYDAPGSDHHGDAKIHSSLAHLYERPRVWIESFHSSGWGGTLEETFDWLLPWLRAGATLYNPHAVYYSTHGGWWEWAPPSTCWRQPYWRHYHIYANTISRLCFLLSQGSHVCDIGVLYPSRTVQSALTVDGALSPAKQADAAYKALAGTMFFLQVETGVLDADRRDFDVLDDDSLQRGTVESGRLRIGSEQFRAIILPACKVLDSATADQLIRFAQGGGLLIAVGCLPDHIVGAPDAVESFHALFASGTALFVSQAADVPAILSRLPRAVEAPVPVLHRRIHDRDVLFVPAAYPHATQSTDSGGSSWLKANYEFSPDRYQRGMTVIARGFTGTPQLWDAVSGEQHAVPYTRRDDSIEITLPFSASPAALIVWTDDAPPVSNGASASPRIVALPDVWESTLEQTLDNRYGDLTQPRFEGAPPVQTWQVEHTIDSTGALDLSRDTDSAAWGQVIATFGAYGWSSGIQPADQLPAPQTNGVPHANDWQPLVYSLQRGIHKDDLHIPALGPKGHVPEEFLHFGRAAAGEGVQFHTTVWMPEAASLHLAVAAPARKHVWINGAPAGDDTPGYLSLIPVQLAAGNNHIEVRLVAESDIVMRAYWALVTDAAAFARPERMIPPDLPRKDSRIVFTTSVDVPFTPASATLQVSADSPCRVVVNGVESGRQGGFDPYASLARVQPYHVQNFRAGANTIEIEIQDIGTSAPVIVGGAVQGVNGHAAVMVDGIVEGSAGETVAVVSGTHWRVRRDDGEPQPVLLFRPQWLDPAWTHLWRRPHPLPEAAWLDGTPTNDVVLPVVPDASADQPQVEWFRWVLPPGAVDICLRVAGDARLWVDGQPLAIDGETVHIPPSDALNRTVTMRVLPQRGRTGGGVFLEPVTYKTGRGHIREGNWETQGLHAYSGGVRYHTTISLDALPASTVTLDLGRVRGTAEVWLNGQPVGVRINSPYQFDLTRAAQAGANTLEVLVLNTLAPYLDAVSPTHYVRPGQTVSGLMGPVRLLIS